ncbi:MAG: hypothetical protein LBK41_02415 [Clostridiales bacterium]|jgi:hypothetical protein|nr:hypothetical protein [Clostridiales bacterium]
MGNRGHDTVYIRGGESDGGGRAGNCQPSKKRACFARMDAEGFSEFRVNQAKFLGEIRERLGDIRAAAMNFARATQNSVGKAARYNA